MVCIIDVTVCSFEEMRFSASNIIGEAGMAVGGAYRAVIGQCQELHGTNESHPDVSLRLLVRHG